MRSLKGLQDRLGDFNDLELQQVDLERMSVEIAKDGVKSAQTVLAMGCLVGKLADKQGALKRSALDGVGAFVDDKTAAELRELLR